MVDFVSLEKKKNLPNFFLFKSMFNTNNSQYGTSLCYESVLFSPQCSVPLTSRGVLAILLALFVTGR